MRTWLSAVLAPVLASTILLLTLISIGGCKKDKALETTAAVLAPALIAQVQDMVDDPAFRAKLGEEGAPIADMALAYLLPRVQNEIAKLGTAEPGSVELLAYKRILRADPDLAAMIYRTVDGRPAGLWPRLEAWLQAKGYLSGPLTFAVLGHASELSEADKDELVKLATIAIAEEYAAVKKAKGAGE